MKTKLTRREQETIIVWNEADDIMSISTYNAALAKKLKDAGIMPTRVECWNTNTWGYEFELNKSKLRIGVKKPLNEEQHEKLVERAAKMRERKNPED